MCVYIYILFFWWSGFFVYRAATSSRSSVKLDSLLRDMEDTLIRDGRSKFVIFSQYTRVGRGYRAVEGGAGGRTRLLA